MRRRSPEFSTRAGLAWVGGTLVFVVVLSVVAEHHPLLAFVVLLAAQSLVFVGLAVALTGPSRPSRRRPRLAPPPQPRLWPGVHERGMVVLHELRGRVLSLGCLGDEGTFSVRVDVSRVSQRDLGRVVAALSFGVVSVEVGGSPPYASLSSSAGSLVAPASRFLVGRDLV